MLVIVAGLDPDRPRGRTPAGLAGADDHATRIGGRDLDGPRIESGNPTGRLPLATDCSLRGEITLGVTESSFLIIDRAK